MTVCDILQREHDTVGASAELNTTLSCGRDAYVSQNGGSADTSIQTRKTNDKRCICYCCWQDKAATWRDICSNMT